MSDWAGPTVSGQYDEWAKMSGAQLAALLTSVAAKMRELGTLLKDDTYPTTAQELTALAGDCAAYGGKAPPADLANVAAGALSDAEARFEDGNQRLDSPVETSTPAGMLGHIVGNLESWGRRFSDGVAYATDQVAALPGTLSWWASYGLWVVLAVVIALIALALWLKVPQRLAARI